MSCREGETVVNFQYKDFYDVNDLVQVVHVLRGPGGCPWDREQDHQSILRNFHEETYEFCDAAQKDDPENMCEELGDVLMQVVFHACMEEEQKRFTIEDVCDGICKKGLISAFDRFTDFKQRLKQNLKSNYSVVRRRIFLKMKKLCH